MLPKFLNFSCFAAIANPMSGRQIKRHIHRAASHDTPDRVKVPNTLVGIAIWAAGRFGVGIVFAAVAFYGTAKVYQDQRELNYKVLEAFTKQIETQTKTQAAIDSLTKAVEILIKQQTRENK